MCVSMSITKKVDEHEEVILVQWKSTQRELRRTPPCDPRDHFPKPIAQPLLHTSESRQQTE